MAIPSPAKPSKNGWLSIAMWRITKRSGRWNHTATGDMMIVPPWDPAVGNHQRPNGFSHDYPKWSTWRSLFGSVGWSFNITNMNNHPTLTTTVDIDGGLVESCWFMVDDGSSLAPMMIQPRAPSISNRRVVTMGQPPCCSIRTRSIKPSIRYSYLHTL